MTSGQTEIRRSILLTSNALTEDTNEKESRNGKDRARWPAERLARRSGPGPRRRGGLQGGRLVRPVRGQGPRRVDQRRARGGARRRGMAAGSAQLRVLRGAVAAPEWRACGQVEQHPQVRRVVHARESRLEQLDSPRGRRGDRGLEAQGGAGR